MSNSKTKPEQAHDLLFNYICELEVIASCHHKGKALEILEEYISDLRTNASDVLFSDMSNSFNVDSLVDFMREIGEDEFASTLKVEVA